ncbi:MAG: extracellular matrix regulator RemB [Acutalibacteraceae bacterium]
MYIHLGQGTVVKTSELVGIFDLESTTVSKHTRNFLNKAEKNKEVITVSYELPKSFAVCRKKGERQRVYISQLASSTLFKRSNYLDLK